MTEAVYFLLIFGGMLMGIQGERWRAAWARSEWRAKRAKRDGWKPNILRSEADGARIPVDATQQLKIVMDAPFEKRRLLSRKEAEVFTALEAAVDNVGRGWRVMAQVSLGEVLASKDAAAFAAINSKRVDMLVVCNRSLPVAAVEYQGSGHYQGTAPARDAVKKEALRRAGISYVEVTPEHGPEDVAAEISRIARASELRPA
ncbi:DUF2726 domain-containing protein [Sphingosinicella rhizophila]|uniref:DUF2726 domain-containing protein n=1 Tax=Sphingosinicella rhizophila TaxID=3050082 RepID=A0ABU3QBW9_9SPHN|nr:DUF2726 domain-containing protein [Sphingosinicella sp. GR2756]MDT9600634.1 DUF2726 domain-containing protein [Sphingosinicella sp. GR2756]